MPDRVRRPAASAALALALSSVLFALMAVIAKRASRGVPGPEVALVRFLVGLVAVAGAALRFRLRIGNWRGLLLRGAFGGAAVLCFFLAIEHLPVGVATLLNYTAPVFTAIWAAAFLREPLGGRSLAALCVTVVGVGLVMYGGALGSFGIKLGAWQLVGVASAMLSGAAVATIREVRRTDGTWEIFGAFCIVGALVTGVPSARHWVPPTAIEWVELVGVGTISVAAQILMTWALRYVRAAAAGIIMQLTPVAALALGWGLYGDRVVGVALAGAAVTVAGVSWGAWQAAAD